MDLIVPGSLKTSLDIIPDERVKFHGLYSRCARLPLSSRQVKYFDLSRLMLVTLYPQGNLIIEIILKFGTFTAYALKAFMSFISKIGGKGLQ